jgi:hypothetical protein
VLELFRDATEEDRRSINENGARNTDAYITTGNGGTALSSNRYWTATERDQYNGWTFYNNGWGFMNKPYTFYVRPVLGF